MKAIKINQEELRKLYCEQEYSTREIGKIFNCTRTAIRNNLKKFGIKIRTWKEANNTERHIMKNSGKNHPNWKGGIMHREGYVLIKKRDHPRARKDGYVKRARLVAEEMLGRYLYLDEIPHHKNEIRNDDRPENIDIITNGEHKSFHNKNRKKEAILDK